MKQISIQTIPGFGKMIGESKPMKKLFNLISKVSKTDSTILITGESGTGKELAARAIHTHSLQSKGAMVVINCGAIPKELLESELFGHEKGAFTNAIKTRIGRFELADGGTIFLDEIGDMSPDLQVKLLRVLQEKVFERVGGTRSIKVNVRVLAATHRDLKESISKNTFREDLYYRLNVIPINVPPLRNRKSDIPLLVDFFLEKLAERIGGNQKKTLSDEAMKILMDYDWQGNIRELENLIERVFILSDDNIIFAEDIPSHITNTPKIHPKKSDLLNPNYEEESANIIKKVESGFDFKKETEKHQMGLITQALEKTNWVKTQAAKLLNMKRTTLIEKMKKMNIKEKNKNE